MESMLDIEKYIQAAKQHGEDSEPDHEVGDLQDILRSVWPLLGEDAKTVAISLPKVREVLVAGSAKMMDMELPTAEDLRRVYQNNPEGCPDFPKADWQYEVANGDTNRGYWEWLAVQIEQSNDDLIHNNPLSPGF